MQTTIKRVNNTVNDEAQQELLSNSELMKNSTLLSMSDNYAHCPMLFELILSLLLQSKETFCRLLVKCCQLLLLVICRSTKRIPFVTKFPVFSHFSHNSLDFERSDEIYLSSSWQKAFHHAVLLCSGAEAMLPGGSKQDSDRATGYLIGVFWTSFLHTAMSTDMLGFRTDAKSLIWHRFWSLAYFCHSLSSSWSPHFE